MPSSVGPTSPERRVSVSEGGSCAPGFGLDSAGTCGCLSCQGLTLQSSRGVTSELEQKARERWNKTLIKDIVGDQCCLRESGSARPQLTFVYPAEALAAKVQIFFDKI